MVEADNHRLFCVSHSVMIIMDSRDIDVVHAIIPVDINSLSSNSFLSQNSFKHFNRRIFYDPLQQLVFWANLVDYISFVEEQASRVTRVLKIKLKGNGKIPPYPVETYINYQLKTHCFLILITCTKTAFKQLIVRNTKDPTAVESCIIFGGNSALMQSTRTFASRA